ncbi:nucleoside-diphosphate-sugar epimerase [Paraburkholderia sp. GAS41]|uniref:NAD-dependent epimerase/dehydratase family protein n=1 Tax=Paraburkholderia sp. GAS41 TaxID=3035134 RepID=UPI003D262598
MTTVAITGATGFVGRHVLDELAKRDLNIVAATRRPVEDRPRYANVTWVTLDVASVPAEGFRLLGQPDVLIHLAWGGLPNYRALTHFEAELPAHYTFLKQLTEAGLKSLLVAGTCLEYGLRSGALVETDPTVPVTSYGLAKDTLRRQLECLQRDRERSFAMTWARLFFMYGEGQASGSIYPQLKQAIQRGDARFRMSGGEQLRDYLDVVEVAQTLVSLALRRVDAGIVNVCSGTPRSVRSMVEQWVREHESEIALELGHYPYPDYEPMAFWGARDKLERLLEIQ